MPFPYEFPVQFEWRHVELLILNSALHQAEILASPLNQRPAMLESVLGMGPQILASGISQRVILSSVVNVSIEMPGRL